MFNILFTTFFLVFYLLTINYFFKKFSIGLDTETVQEKHKSLLRSDNSTPLSGTLYFLPLILFLFYDKDYLFIICCSSLFILGFFADLKIITSYKKRLIIQFIFISALFFFHKDIAIYTRLYFVDNLMNYDFVRIVLCTFFFMVLINGYNLIDGTNCLSSLNFVIILIFIILVINDLKINYVHEELSILLKSLIIFLVLNFFGKNFLGDGAVYGLSFLLGYILLKISLIDNSISPYFIANLLWYPAFENLFSIVRRNLTKKNNYLPDNEHLHHLIFKIFKKKAIIKKEFLFSSLIGIFINFILSINYLVGYKYYNHSWIQIILILSGIILYLIAYFSLKKKLN
tara:strand:+ start:6870 stop:7898 length:1029 start_codon:yes stop_codon:yes gene_type:complete